ncbi:rCG63078 [Rattus norvegicus]|uniref:RCG63078 n=1 Tax=Rattus norvegicus TaxID=10116 RepID=A6KEX0_RAT|nr:rCG63078 [Rattus norvegicus]
MSEYKRIFYALIIHVCLMEKVVIKKRSVKQKLRGVGSGSAESNQSAGKPGACSSPLSALDQSRFGIRS